MLGVKRALLIGTNHYDPLGRQKIHNMLVHFKNERDFIPDFIAVEWKEDYAKRIISQRPLYQQLLSEKYPLLSHTDILTLANSLAYEADSHIDLYPEKAIIWLDDNRAPVVDEIINNYAHRTLRVQADNLYHAKINDPRDLQLFSYAAYYVSDKTRAKGNERDVQFFQTTCAYASETTNIVGILGALHIDPATPGGYARLLQDAGFDVESIRIDAPV